MPAYRLAATASKETSSLETERRTRSSSARCVSLSGEVLFESSLLPRDLMARLTVLVSRLWRQGQELQTSSGESHGASVH